MKPISQSENNARAAALVTSYGVGTRSYNRSAEKREIDRQRAEATAKYEREHRAEILVGPMCACRSFDFPHELSRHRELRSESDWRTQKERRNQEWGWR